MADENTNVATKDIFDDCRATEECAASNQNLQCINQLCVCSSPFVLRADNECVPGSSWSESNIRSILASGSVFLIITLVTGVICLLTRKFQKGSQSSESPECSTLQGTALHDEGGHPRQDPAQRSLFRKIPTSAYEGVRHLYRRSLSFSARSSSITGDQGPLVPPRRFWPEGGLRSVANKLYPSKLVDRLRRRSHQEEDSHSSPEPVAQQSVPQQPERQQNWTQQEFPQQNMQQRNIYSMQPQSMSQAIAVNMPSVIPRPMPQQFSAAGNAYPSYPHYGEGPGMQMPQAQRPVPAAPFVRTENAAMSPHDNYQRQTEVTRQYAYPAKYVMDEMDPMRQ